MKTKKQVYEAEAEAQLDGMCNAELHMRHGCIGLLRSAKLAEIRESASTPGHAGRYPQLSKDLGVLSKALRMLEARIKAVESEE